MSYFPDRLYELIASPRNKCFRRMFIKRRDVSTGLFESEWQEITSDVESWGSMKKELDVSRVGKFRFSNMKVKVSNTSGRYNESTDIASLWYGYAPEQRTLVKIQWGFLDQTKTDGIWTNVYMPFGTLYDEAIFDSSSYAFDDIGLYYIGILSGDIQRDDTNSITLNISPVTKVFQDYPASLLTNYNPAGVTASQFVAMLRDQTDGSSNFIFRPFFEDTTGNWNIATTTAVYSSLNTSSSAIIIDKSAWDVLELLCEAERHVAYVAHNGIMTFRPSNYYTGTAFQFHGIGIPDQSWGNTLKSISGYGKKISTFYSRVQCKHKEEETTTSYYSKESAMTVNGANAAWNYGFRTLDIRNEFINTTATAQTLVDSLYTELSTVKNEINFTTSFVPHLELQEKCAIYYRTSRIDQGSLWDLNNWDEMTWDKYIGDGLRFEGKEFQIISIDINLDRLECKFIGREA